MRYGYLVLAGLLAAQPAAVTGQTRSIAEELRVNVHVGPVHLGGYGTRAGPGVSAAYGNARWFTVFATWDRARFAEPEFPFTLQHVDLGSRVHLRGAEARLVPFAVGAWTWRSARYGTRPFMGDTADVVVHGSGLTFGAGAQYYVRPRLAVEGSVKLSTGALDRVTADHVHFRSPEHAIRGRSLRVKLGGSWYPWVPGSR